MKLPWGFGQRKEKKRKKLQRKNWLSALKCWKNSWETSLILVETALALWMWPLFLCSVGFIPTISLADSTSSTKPSSPISLLGPRGALKESMCPSVFLRNKGSKSICRRESSWTLSRLETGLHIGKCYLYLLVYCMFWIMAYKIALWCALCFATYMPLTWYLKASGTCTSVSI